MTYLMIHDMRPEYLDLDLKKYRLTFDDGLFSQYYYYPLLKKQPGKLIYFITTAFIKPGKARGMYAGDNLPYLKSKKYMYRTFIEGRFDHFMTMEEIQHLAARPDVQVGVHSHFHDVVLTRTHASKRKPLAPWKLARFKNQSDISALDMSARSKLAFQGYYFEHDTLTRRSEMQWEEYIRRDTQLSVEWMIKNLGITPELYCFPFNEHNEKLISMLKAFGFKQFFAARPGESREVVGRTDIDRLLAD
jgi:hypothetical protein